jgi:hypothetical protein
MKFPFGRLDLCYFIIPLILSVFTHFWNSADYPAGPSNDEGIYIRRAMNVLSGLGPQESLLYDHPYFSQIFLASIFYLINYPHIIHLSINSIDSIRMLFLVPRIIMAIIVLVDTALVYLISKYWYNNRTIAITTSTLFAVMPLTDPIRRVLLESIQLPFFLLSILFAIYSTKIKSIYSGNNNNNRNMLFILLSGLFLGLAIFTKIPIFTMIPLIVFIIYKNKLKKILILWIIPVIVIPLFWPAYALYKNELNLWINGLYFQTHRGAQTLFEVIKYNFQYDHVLLSLGIIGIFFSIIKKDLFILIWIFPFLAFLYYVGFVSYWHIIPLFPLFCIAAGKLIYESSGLLFRKKNFQKFLTFTILLGISGYSLYGYTEVIGNSNNNNTSHFKAIAFIDEYLYKAVHYEPNNKNNLVVISSPFYSWIPRFVFHLNNYQYIDYLDDISVKSNRVLMIADHQWEYEANHNMLSAKMIENYKLYSKNKIATFGIHGINNNNYDISIYSYDLQNRTKIS